MRTEKTITTKELRTARTVRKKEVKTERTITNQGLLDLGFYQEGMVRFIDQTNNTNKPVVITSLIGGKNNTKDLLWLAGKIYPLKKVVQFGVNCAELVSHLNPDSRIQLAINATKDWVEAPTKENEQAAGIAARAASAWARTTDIQAYVARAAAVAMPYLCTAYGAQNSATSAVRYTLSAANAHSEDFGREIEGKINELLKDLFKE